MGLQFTSVFLPDIGFYQSSFTRYWILPVQFLPDIGFY